MFARIKLWWLMRQINHLEEYEAELNSRLKELRNKALPRLRDQRNRLMFPRRVS